MLKWMFSLILLLITVSTATASTIQIRPRTTVLPKLQLSSPVFGDSFVKKATHLSIAPTQESFEIGSTSQAFTIRGLDELFGAFLVIGIVLTVVYLTAGLTLAGGNIAAAIRKRSQLGWGIAGTTFFALFTILGILALPGSEGGNIGGAVALTAVNAAFLGLSIFNIVDWARGRARRRRIADVSPWFRFDRTQSSLSGGLALKGSF